MERLDPRRATVFGRYAADYDRWRPDYPDAALAWLLPDGAARVADVGAGTGKLTRGLLARGLEVDAVEPDADMLAELVRTAPAAHAHRAGAEALPLPDASVDAVLVAQAWHWFHHEAAIAEVRRVLRPGGRLGLLWNGLTSTDGGWAGELARLDPDRPGKLAAPRPRRTGLPDDELEHADFRWTWQVSPDDVRGYFSTHSGLTGLDPDERERRLDRAHAIVARACAEAGTGTIGWSQTVECVRWSPRVRPTG